MTKFEIVQSNHCHNEEEEELIDLPPEPFKGKIRLEGCSLKDNALESGMGITLSLDGRIDASLDWSSQIQEAEQSISKGYKILWDLDLGLFSHLLKPLGDEGQLLALRLSLQHFRELIWDRFKHETIGLLLYKGNYSFDDLTEDQLEKDSPFQEWVKIHSVENKEPKTAHAYHRRDVAAGYFSLLLASLPEELRVFHLLKVPEGTFPSLVLGLLNPDRFEKIEWILESDVPLHSTWHKRGELLVPNETGNAPHGFCIPFPHWMPDQPSQLDTLLQKEGSLRFVPEGAITAGWDQLDQLYVLDPFLTPFGKRQLQGFMAAGGTVNWL